MPSWNLRIKKTIFFNKKGWNRQSNFKRSEILVSWTKLDKCTEFYNEIISRFDGIFTTRREKKKKYFWNISSSSSHKDLQEVLFCFAKRYEQNCGP